MKNVKTKLRQLIHSTWRIIKSRIDLSFVGFFVIFGSFALFGEVEMWSWQMWAEIIGVAIGGIILIQHGENSR